MELIWDGIREAFRLIFTGNSEVYEIALLSLTVSAAATGIALVIGLGIASFLAFRAPPGRTRETRTTRLEADSERSKS